MLNKAVTRHSLLVDGSPDQILSLEYTYASGLRVLMEYS